MSYSDGEELVLRRLRECDNFNSLNTARGNWGILNKGQSTSGAYAICRPGGTTITWNTVTHYINRHLTVIEVWQRYTTDGGTLLNLEKRVEDVVKLFQKRNRLDDTEDLVVDVNVRTISEVQEMWRRKGVLSWLRQDVYLEWQEEIDVEAFA